MSPLAKQEYLRAVYHRYQNANRPQKKLILDELCENCHFHRKHAIRLLSVYHPFLKPRKKPRGRMSIYKKIEILRPLKKIWLTANLPCSKRLKAILPIWIPSYESAFSSLEDQIKFLLLRISPATIDRLMAPTRRVHTHKGRSTTKPGTLLKKHIPIKTNQWDEFRPGFLEADTVAHCGASTLGTYVSSIDVVDIATGWTEQRAVWGKGYHEIITQITDIEADLPFPILGFDSDNGSEFLNHHLWRYFCSRPEPVQFTRSRAYYKNDNAHIEQKNWTHIRQWLGYDRFENPDIVPLLNDLFTSEWRLFHNFFCPSVKLLEKNRVGSKTIKKFDDPKTPYQRVLASPHIPDSTKAALTKTFKTLNAFDLRRAMEAKIKTIFSKL
jgi:hypothetical protein